MPGRSCAPPNGSARRGLRDRCGPVWPPTWRENARSPGPIRPGRPILLPAEYGFVEGDTIVVNPSYIMPRCPARGGGCDRGSRVLAQVAGTKGFP